MLYARPGVRHVDHQRKVRANRFATGRHHGHPLGVVGLQPVVAVRTVDADFDFRGPVSQRLHAAHLFDQRNVLLGHRIAHRQQRRIGHHRPRAVSSQQFIDRLAQRLAAQVPQRHVKRSDRADHRPAPPGHFRTAVELLPQRLGIQRIGPQQHFLQPQPHAVRAAGANALPCDPGIRVRFADADEPFVGMNLDHQVVLRRRTSGRVVVGNQQHVTIDFGDLHASVGAKLREEIRKGKWSRWILTRRASKGSSFARLRGAFARVAG